jgi:DNA-binding transcriptional ArsR family regulator
VIELHLSPEDLSRIRFAVSPLFETKAAVRTLAAPARRAQHLPWLRAVARAGPPLELAPLLALMPEDGYVPDFLTPPPQGPLAEIGEELERVRATPPEQVAREIGWSLEGRETPPALAPLLGDPAAARDRLCALLAACWERLVEPFWPRLRDVLDGDILFRARRLAQGGVEQVFADLHPLVRFEAGTLSVAKHHELSRDLRGEGVVLLPSAFAWPDAFVVLDPPWQPTLVYPARGVAALWEAPAAGSREALAALVGRSRAALLADLGEARATTALAERHGLAPATVSGHLRALRDAGLVAPRRDGRRVLYQRTPLGYALARAGRGGA